MRQLYDELRADGGMGRLVDVMQGFEVTDASDDLILQGLKTPVPQLFVWGERDPVLGRDIAYLPMLAAHQQLHRIADAKHYLMMDHAEEISDVIRQWLVTVAARPGR